MHFYSEDINHSISVFRKTPSGGFRISYIGCAILIGAAGNFIMVFLYKLDYMENGSGINGGKRKIFLSFFVAMQMVRS